MNPDLILVRRFHADPSTPLAVDSNPLAVALQAMLVRIDDGALVMSFEPGPAFLQGAVVIQGGIVAAMLDFVMGFAVMGVTPAATTTATAQLGVNYLRPLRAGPCHAIGTVDRRGISMAFTSARLLDADSDVIATATAVCPILHHRSAPPNAA